MADNTTLQTTVATPPSGLVVATIETASDGHVERVQIGGGVTCTTSSVAGNAGNVTLLAANNDRMGATIYNDSNAILYVKCGTTASLSSFTIALGPGGYYEIPFGYRGNIDGIWDVATGNARMGEFT